MFSLVFFIYHFSRFRDVSALPIPAIPYYASVTPRSDLSSRSNATAQTVGWTSAPNLRGTSDLLISCLTTLSLCAWTAYHPNVSGPRGAWRATVHRISWMVIAIVVPEMVLYCAWEQWWAATRLKKEVNALGKSAIDGAGGGGVGGDDGTGGGCRYCRAMERIEYGGLVGDYALDLLFGGGGEGEDVADNEEEDGDVQANGQVGSQTRCSHSSTRTSRSTNSNHDERLSEKIPTTADPIPEIWTTEQAFFALAGGFAIPSSTFSSPPRLIFTPSGLLFLAKLGLLPTSTPDTVSDKSKADVIAKVLVCIQAGWFLVQCIARLAQKLPISLLELHVLAHVLCAFAMYVVWLKKPYDATSPIQVEDERVVDLGALFALHIVKPETVETSSLQQISYPACSKRSVINLTQVQSAHKDFQSASPWTRHLRFAIQHLGDAGELRNFLNHTKSLFSTSRSNSLTRPSQSTPSPASPIETEHLTRSNRALAYLAERNIHLTYESNTTTHLHATSDPNEHALDLTSHTSITLPSLYIVPLRSNLVIDGLPSPSADDSRSAHVNRALMSYAVLSAAYGGLHLAAWNARFATPVEMWGWRSAGLVMVGAPVLSALFVGGEGAYAWVLMKIKEGARKRFGRKRKDGGGDGEQEQGIELQSRDRNVLQQNSRSSADRASSLHASRQRSVDWPRVGTVALKVLYKPLDYLVTLGFAVPGFVAMLAWACYPVVRVYVLVEAFAALRASEPNLYKTVEWTDFIPHAG
ncbi:hypothetical protein K491DRAFT_694349 [Lophiostoma macrostomum CBS 122681]|uniref:Uncharacterized protein n=1 Tax=Lophiostoma macrostomum CBS 122681 TaxID=1314788 RepID=A0A6A6T3B2_9PLEO|nr:hypothetical protein K491DRAFT_694349 [Lophiostoma macrostomum CBS 122681]